MNTIWEFIQHQLATNQLFGGGLILMVGGGLLAYFRDIPSRIWIWLRRRWVIEIDILDRDPAFEWIDKWLAQHTYAKDRARSLTVKTMAVDYANDRQTRRLMHVHEFCFHLPRASISFSIEGDW